MTATPTATPTTPGSIVRARGREWVVLPNPPPNTLKLRPLGGGDQLLTRFHPLVVEECLTVDAATDGLRVLPEAEALALLQQQAVGNVQPGQRQMELERALRRRWAPAAPCACASAANPACRWM